MFTDAFLKYADYPVDDFNETIFLIKQYISQIKSDNNSISLYDNENIYIFGEILDFALVIDDNHFNYRGIPFHIGKDDFINVLQLNGFVINQTDSISCFCKLLKTDNNTELWVHWLKENNKIYMVQEVWNSVNLRDDDKDLVQFMNSFINVFNHEPVTLSETSDGYSFKNGAIFFRTSYEPYHPVLQYIDYKYLYTYVQENGFDPTD